MRTALVLLALATALRSALAAPVVVVRAGDPSALGLPFSAFSNPALDDRGHVAFVGTSAVVFGSSGGGIVHRLGAGDGVAGRTLAGVAAPALGPNGCIVLRAAFTGGGAGLVRECGGVSEIVAQTGDTSPAGGTLVGFANELAVGSGGRIAFTATLDDRSNALFVADAPRVFTEVVRTGTPSPAGGTFSGLRVLGVTAGGGVGFRGSASAGPDGLFVWDGAHVTKLVVTGDASPAGGAFTSLGIGAMDDADGWTFRASVSSGPRTGVFRASTASAVPVIASVVLDGQPTPLGGTFKSFPTALLPAINRGGAIAFRAPIADADASAAVFVAGADGTLVRAMAVGDLTAAGKITRLREVALADDGHVIVRATISNGTVGLFRGGPDGTEGLALLGDATDLGGGFRFSDPSVRDRVDDAVFLGVREGLFIAEAPGETRMVARLGETTPLRGQYTRFDPPAAGAGGRIVFGAGIQAGRVRDALLVARGRRPPVLVKTGEKVGHDRIVALFSSPLDDEAHAAVGPGAVAFQAGLSGHSGATGIVLWSGGSVRAIARDGQNAPGGGRYLEFGTPAVGAGARVAFVARAGENNTTLFRSGGGGTVPLAMWGAHTGTRLSGVFRGFDTPAAAGSSVAFRAFLDQSRQGIFLARRGCRMALAGTGEGDPSGGRFTSFGAPTFAGAQVVFRGNVIGGAAPIGLYRATLAGTCTRVAPTLEALAVAGTASTPLDLGPPSGNRRGALVLTTDETGAGPTDTILFLSP